MISSHSKPLISGTDSRKSCQIKPAFSLSEKGKLQLVLKAQVLFSIRDVGT